MVNEGETASRVLAIGFITTPLNTLYTSVILVCVRQANNVEVEPTIRAPTAPRKFCASTKDMRVVQLMHDHGYPAQEAAVSTARYIVKLTISTYCVNYSVEIYKLNR